MHAGSQTVIRLELQRPPKTSLWIPAYAQARLDFPPRPPPEPPEIDFTSKTSRKANYGANHRLDVSWFCFSLYSVPWAGETVYQPAAISV